MAERWERQDRSQQLLSAPARWLALSAVPRKAAYRLHSPRARRATTPRRGLAEMPQTVAQNPLAQAPACSQRAASALRRRSKLLAPSSCRQTDPRRGRLTVPARRAAPSWGSVVPALQWTARVLPGWSPAPEAASRETKSATADDHPCDGPSESDPRAIQVAPSSDHVPQRHRSHHQKPWLEASSDWPTQARRAQRAAAEDRARAVL